MALLMREEDFTWFNPGDLLARAFEDAYKDLVSKVLRGIYNDLRRDPTAKHLDRHVGEDGPVVQRALRELSEMGYVVGPARQNPSWHEWRSFSGWQPRETKGVYR